jgi:hypothetical protein
MKVISVRLSDELHEALVSSAKKESRSVNGQIVHFINEGVMVPQWEAQSVQMFREDREKFLSELAGIHPVMLGIPDIERIKEDER